MNQISNMISHLLERTLDTCGAVHIMFLKYVEMLLRQSNNPSSQQERLCTFLWPLGI